ncbi:MAG: cyclic nucleotide-binding protein, partial [Betaproteobacteria bacterium]|nr:cyclic nucleotide-binding protein [Betaproteobacteria bacterium]
GEIIFKELDYTNTFYSIVAGSVDVEIKAKDAGSKPSILNLKAGQYFGEMGLISGRRRTATVRAGADCVLLETPRRTMLKLISSVEDVRKQTDEKFVRNAIFNYLGPMLGPEAVDALMAGGVELRRYNTNDVVTRDGDQADGLYLIRRGSVTVSKIVDGKDKILSPQ